MAKEYPQECYLMIVKVKLKKIRHGNCFVFFRKFCCFLMFVVQTESKRYNPERSERCEEPVKRLTASARRFHVRRSWVRIPVPATFFTHVISVQVYLHYLAIVVVHGAWVRCKMYHFISYYMWQLYLNGIKIFFQIIICAILHRLVLKTKSICLIFRIYEYLL